MSQPEMGTEVELELAGANWDAFHQMMEDTVLDSDLVRIDWLLEKMRDAQAEIAANNETADRRIAMQEDFRQGENAKLLRHIEWLTGQIGVLAPASGEAMKAEYGKKSRTLAHGKFGFKQRPDSIEIEDTVLSLGFARAQGLPVKTTQTVSKTDLKRYAKHTGDTEGEGWRLVPGGDEFFVTAAT